MSNSSFPRGSSHLHQKRVRVRLAGGQSIEGSVHIPDGQPLLHFLGMRRHFLNLTSVRRVDPDPEGAPVEHLSLRLSSLVWVIPLDDSLHVSTALPATTSPRAAELQLVDGLVLTVTLNIAAEHRMSDYLDANPGFLPFWSARLQGGEEVIERMAVNHTAILAVREVTPETRSAQP